MFQRSPFVEGLEVLRDALVCLSRYSALDLLSQRRLDVQMDKARSTAKYVEQAVEVETFLSRHYSRRGQWVEWPEEMRPDVHAVLVTGRVSPTALEGIIEDFSRTVHFTAAHLRAAAQASVLLEPVLLFLEKFTFGYGAAPQGREIKLPLRSDRERGPGPITKAFAGPLHVKLDPAFEPTFSLTNTAEPRFGDSDASTIFHFWCLAMHEAMAAQLCALSLVEYDGLPLEFYRDMAKQTWDEMRHARYFFDAAVAFLPILSNELGRAHPLLEAVDRFRTTGTGLPVPLEENLYEAIWNADLIERLILMQIETETPGVALLKRRMNSDFCRRYPDVAVALDMVANDEIFHARIGRRWLEHILPEQREREDAIEQTLLLRPVLLLTSFIHHSDAILGDLMQRLRGEGSEGRAEKPIAFLGKYALQSRF